MRKPLKHVSINEEMFNKFLAEFEDYVLVVDNLSNDVYGYQDKKTVKYDKERSAFITQAYRLSYILDMDTSIDGWRQLVVHISSDPETIIDETVSGSYATMYLEHRILNKKYSDIDSQLSKFEADEDPIRKQQHYFYSEDNKITKFEDAYYYDINKAHADALCEIFPESKADILKLYRTKDKATLRKNKQLINFYVGNLVNRGHRRTYNWIVQRTTDILTKMFAKLGGDAIYINTDGIILNNVKNVVESSKNVGEFKLEYHGDVYTYRDKNYEVVQYGDTIKGHLPLVLRDQVDLRIGQVVHYDRVKVGVHYEYQNITKENLNEKN